MNDLNGTMIDSNAQFTVPPNVNLPAGSAGVLLGFRPDGTVLFSGDTDLTVIPSGTVISWPKTVIITTPDRRFTLQVSAYGDVKVSE